MLTRAATKWHVNQPRATHSTFASLAKDFISYFQSPLHYDTNVEHLTSFCQTSATHISDHVKECRRRRSIYRAPKFEDHIYMDWFHRSLLAPVSKDVASHFP